jgi:hypothetical protein
MARARRQNLVNAAGLDAALRWTLFNPDPSVTLDQQYLDPTRVIQTYRFRTHHLLELRQAPLNIRVSSAAARARILAVLFFFLVGASQRRLLPLVSLFVLRHTLHSSLGEM